MWFRDLPEFKLMKKKKYYNYKLRESKRDIYSNRIDVYEKKKNAKSIDTVKLYYPNPEKIIKETNDLCEKCEVGYLIYHPVLFRDNSEHIQVSCNMCHRYHCYLGQES